jgi:hypothetical protein
MREPAVKNVEHRVVSFVGRAADRVIGQNHAPTRIDRVQDRRQHAYIRFSAPVITSVSAAIATSFAGSSEPTNAE